MCRVDVRCVCAGWMLGVCVQGGCWVCMYRVDAVCMYRVDVRCVCTGWMLGVYVQSGC